MRPLVFSLCFISIFLFQNSVEQIVTTDYPDTENLTANATETPELTTTTNWWRKTTPIKKTRPPIPRPPTPPAATKKPPLVSDGVLYAIPILLLMLTVVLGFGAIIYAIRTNGGNGIAIFTRTNDPPHVVQRDS